ncbi:MAG: WcaF family extracellular polysaccharide biosynthesis acetyltransferase [Planctomycetota bacterium]
MSPKTEKSVDLTGGATVFPYQIYVVRSLWKFVYFVFFRLSPRLLYSWRRFLLRAFGAKIGKNVHIYPSVLIEMPWKLSMSDNSVMGPRVLCYNMGGLSIGKDVVISQNSHLCSATHDHTSSTFKTVFAPIHIGDGSWICADVFVAPGVTIGDGAVVGARSVVVHDVKAWTIVAGNPAKYMKDRQILP